MIGFARFFSFWCYVCEVCCQDSSEDIVAYCPSEGPSNILALCPEGHGWPLIMLNASSWMAKA